MTDIAMEVYEEELVAHQFPEESVGKYNPFHMKQNSR
jgi:hypothetical protein